MSESRFVWAGGVETHYLEAGPSDGEPVVNARPPSGSGLNDSGSRAERIRGRNPARRPLHPVSPELRVLAVIDYLSDFVNPGSQPAVEYFDVASGESFRTLDSLRRSVETHNWSVELGGEERWAVPKEAFR